MDDDEGFGPIAFELLGRRPTGQETGPERKARLLSDVRRRSRPREQRPEQVGVPLRRRAARDRNPRKADAIGRRFLQAEWFHHRGRREEWENPPPPTPPAVFEPDFHKIVTLVARYPKLVRLLGLVFELEFPLARTLTSPDTQVQVRLGDGRRLGARHTPRCRPAPTARSAARRSTSTRSTTRRTTRWRATTSRSATRPRTSSAKSTRMAARSRRCSSPTTSRARGASSTRTARETFYTPDRFHLPAHSSAGLMVSRLGRAYASGARCSTALS